jgi:hypothetical protein
MSLLWVIAYNWASVKSNDWWSEIRSATSTETPGRQRPCLSIAVAALGCAVLIAACGSSTKPSIPSSHGTAFLNFSECMRSHGVPNFPDPSPGGGIHLSSGINPFSPAFKAAQASCRKLLPGGGPPAHASAQDKALMVKTSECMRAHGVTGFPDPTTTAPSNPAGYSILEDRGGIVLAVPNTINIDSPVFKQAAAACKFSG